MKNFDLKKFLKQVKLKEDNISMILGALVIVIAGILVVNYFRTNRGQTLPEATNTSGPEATMAKSYVVTEGESLWTISEEVYGTGYNWVDIYKANNLTSEELEVGQKLTLPQVMTKVTQDKEPVKSPLGSTYTVVKGDSLWNIAVDAYGDGYQWVKIARENKLSNPDLIHVGNVLTLPR